MKFQQHLPAFGATVALMLAISAFWTAPALTASLTLTFVSVPLAVVCAVLGSRRIALMALYFSIAAWLPLLMSRYEVADSGSVFQALLIGGVALAVVLALDSKIRASAT